MPEAAPPGRAAGWLQPVRPAHGARGLSVLSSERHRRDGLRLARVRLLTGAFTEDTTFEAADWRSSGVAFGQPILGGDNFRHNVRLVNRLRDEVARPMGLTVAQLALAWVVRNPSRHHGDGRRARARRDRRKRRRRAVQLSRARRGARSKRSWTSAAGRVDVFRPFRWAMEVWD